MRNLNLITFHMEERVLSCYYSNPLYLYRFKLPVTSPLIFEDIFYQVEESTIESFKEISQTRNELVVASERSFTSAAMEVLCWFFIYVRVLRDIFLLFMDLFFRLLLW